MTGSAAHQGGSLGPVFVFPDANHGVGPVAQTKQFKTYPEQVELLRSRGMNIPDKNRAERLLGQLNYYRLSGYWYPMRRFIDGHDRDEFVDGTSFDLVVSLYEFDEHLRHMAFTELDRIEMVVRTMLGYELGRIDPLICLSPSRLGARARQPLRDGRTVHETWLTKYKSAVKNSKEDFVAHHEHKYGGTMPIWAAVEVMDWGMLSYLYGMSPSPVRNRIASRCSLRAPQLESWLKSLNILRNLTAHHGRIFNRVYDVKPKLRSGRADEPRLRPALTHPVSSPPTGAVSS